MTLNLGAIQGAAVSINENLVGRCLVFIPWFQRQRMSFSSKATFWWNRKRPELASHTQDSEYQDCYVSQLY